MTAPFGIEFFSSLAAYEILNEFGESKYRIAAPLKHPGFDTYVVQCTPRLGVTWVKALSAEIAVDNLGGAARAAADRIAGQIEHRYSKYRKLDFLASGALWDDDRYWMNALADGQRFYSYTWDKSAGSVLPNDLDNVYLGVIAYDSSTAAVTVEYSSIRSNEAVDEVERELSNFF